MRTPVSILALATLAASASAFDIITTGHWDIGVGLHHGDELEPHIHGHSPDTEYAPDEAGFYIQDNHRATTSVAVGGLLGLGSGETFWRLPQSSPGTRIYLGWGAEEIDPGTLDEFTITDARAIDIAGTDTAEWVIWRLTGFSGPGEFAVWTGTASTVTTSWMSTADGIGADDAFFMTAGSHEHTNFGFSEVGNYAITFTVEAMLGGNLISADGTYNFGVETTPVPEPATVAVLGLGALALARRRRRV